MPPIRRKRRDHGGDAVVAQHDEAHLGQCWEMFPSLGGPTYRIKPPLQYVMSLKAVLHEIRSSHPDKLVARLRWTKAFEWSTQRYRRQPWHGGAGGGGGGGGDNVSMIPTAMARAHSAAAVASVELALERAVQAPVEGGQDPTLWLPDEILQHILLSAPFESLWNGRCALVCRRWRNLIRGSRSIQRRLREERWEAYATNLIESRFLGQHDYGVTALALGPQGEIYSGSLDRTIAVWSADGRKILRRFQGHSGGVRALAVAPCGTVYSGSHDKTICAWHPTTGQLLRTYEGHTGGVRALAVAADGTLYSGGMDRSVIVWGADGTPKRTLVGHSNAVLALAVTPSGELISGSWDHSIRVWCPTTGACIKELIGHDDAIRALTVDADGHVYSASEDRVINVWDLEDGVVLRTLIGHTADIFALAIGPSGRLYSGAYDSVVMVWADDGRPPLHIETGRTGGVSALVVTQDERLVCGSGDCSLSVW
eukprot:m.159088 g.159088  ORF g.159088 m.159088 type:complete len:482 (+) comp11740_c0_seq1:1112-2557(+)